MRAPQYGQNKKRLKAPMPPRENALLGRVISHAKRDRKKSRNDNRVYAWAIGFNKADNCPRF
jgi:hypothetical protein